MRAALYGWAFNARARANGAPPAEITRTIQWLDKHTMQVGELMKPELIRLVLARIGRTLDGRPAAASTIGRKRAVLHNALEYAVERELLPQNPLTALKIKKTRTAEAIDKRVMVSPAQAVQLLEAVRGQGRTGRHLLVLFGLLYYAALRPAEAVAVSKEDLAIPEQGWGELYLPRSEPTTGAAWADSGNLRHAAVSTWLNGGVAPTQVAEWAGHSVAVLLRAVGVCLPGFEPHHAAKTAPG